MKLITMRRTKLGSVFAMCFCTRVKSKCTQIHLAYAKKTVVIVTYTLFLRLAHLCHFLNLIQIIQLKCAICTESPI